MKLAEALLIRSDQKKKLASLRERITRNVIVQEGETPSEDVEELLRQASGVMQEHIKIAQLINAANQTRKLADAACLQGFWLTEMPWYTSIHWLRLQFKRPTRM